MNILIIGAGPCGLFTAYKFLKDPNNKVTILEKRSEYTRSNILRLDNNNLNTFDIIDNNIKQLLDSYNSFNVPYCSNIAPNQIPIDCPNDCSTQSTINPRYPYNFVIDEMENSLLSLCSTNPNFTMYRGFSDMTYCNWTISVVLTTGQQYTFNILDYCLFVIADGASSTYREIFLPNSTYCIGSSIVKNNIKYFSKYDNNVVKSDCKYQPLCTGLTISIDLPQCIIDSNCYPKYNDLNYNKSKKITFDGETLFEITTNCLCQLPNPKSEQYIYRIFIGRTRLFITLMISEELNYNMNMFYQLPKYVQVQLYFILMYNKFDFTIPQDNKVVLFPVYFSNVIQSCTYNNNTIITCVGDAMVSGNFHTGSILNENFIAINKMVNNIMNYKYTCPDTKTFIDKVFHKVNLSNIKIINRITKMSIDKLPFDGCVDPKVLQDSYYSFVNYISCNEQWYGRNLQLLVVKNNDIWLQYFIYYVTGGGITNKNN